MKEQLSGIQEAVLQEMNRGMYLFKAGSMEGVGYNDKIKTHIKKGTIDKLVGFGFVKQSEYLKSKFLLTEEGRAFRKIER